MLTGLAALSAGAAGSPVTREARRLAATLQLATEESRLQGRVLGLKFQHDGYSYLELIPREPDDESGTWFRLETIAPKRGFCAQELAAADALRICESTAARWRPRSGAAASAPQILLLPEGEFTPFTLRLVGTREAGGHHALRFFRTV